MFLLTSNFVKNNHIQVEILYIFLKTVLKKTWNTFNTKFPSEWKDWKRSYRVMEAVAVFCNLIALTLD